ncbi:hypothetical protein WJX72_000273 [[Myrmecia] bisecta]|uniref:Threonylcarbamoyl-AMP synthase n=1 Tax=[Myrmecia] bisecta TaxID=41462 RepID=A0AAW1QNU0_9CHLO
MADCCLKTTLLPSKSAKRQKFGSSGSSKTAFISVKGDASDTWRLDAVVDLIKAGGVGIIPTDTYPALVCDIDDKRAVEKLYTIKEMSPSKPLSILCRNFQDINTYTLGFPASNAPGRRDMFRLARQALPGPYTFILLASKQLPKQCVDYLTGKSKTRRSVGVRLPADDICQALLSQLDRPLLCSSMYVDQESPLRLADAAVLADQYAGRGIDFVVDSGQRMAEGSTIIDLTGPEPQLLRQGKGDASMFLDVMAMA